MQGRADRENVSYADNPIPPEYHSRNAIGYPNSNGQPTSTRRRTTTRKLAENDIVGGTWFEAPGTFNGIPVDAVPDSGSSINAISEDFARRHNFNIIPGDSSIGLIGKRKAEILGRVVGNFQFKGEKQVYRREFHVLRKCLPELVLGDAFLKETKTRGLASGRITTRIRPMLWSGNRFCC